VVSDLVKPKPATRVVAWIESCEERSLYLSVITLGELEKGVAKLPASGRRARLEGWIRRDLPDRFRSRIPPVDEAVATCLGDTGRSRRKAGKRAPGDRWADRGDGHRAPSDGSDAQYERLCAQRVALLRPLERRLDGRATSGSADRTDSLGMSRTKRFIAAPPFKANVSSAKSR